MPPSTPLPSQNNVQIGLNSAFFWLCFETKGLVLGWGWKRTSTPQLPAKIPQIPSNRDHKALNGGTLGGGGGIDVGNSARC